MDFSPSITIHAKPNSKKTEIMGIKDGIYQVAVKAPPEDNKANCEIIRFFRKITKKQVRMLKGFTSKTKVLQFQ